MNKEQSNQSGRNSVHHYVASVGDESYIVKMADEGVKIEGPDDCISDQLTKLYNDSAFENVNRVAVGQYLSLEIVH